MNSKLWKIVALSVLAAGISACDEPETNSCTPECIDATTAVVCNAEGLPEAQTCAQGCNMTTGACNPENVIPNPPAGAQCTHLGTMCVNNDLVTCANGVIIESVACPNGCVNNMCQSGSASDNKCTADSCKDGNTLLVCNADGSTKEQACANGCANGKCNASSNPDPGSCTANSCKDGNTLLVCNADGTTKDQACAYGCENGACKTAGTPDDTPIGGNCNSDTYVESCDGEVVMWCNDGVVEGMDCSPYASEGYACNTFTLPSGKAYANCVNADVLCDTAGEEDQYCTEYSGYGNITFTDVCVKSNTDNKNYWVNIDLEQCLTSDGQPGGYCDAAGLACSDSDTQESYDCTAEDCGDGMTCGEACLDYGYDNQAWCVGLNVYCEDPSTVPTGCDYETKCVDGVFWECADYSWIGLGVYEFDTDCAAEGLTCAIVDGVAGCLDTCSTDGAVTYACQYDDYFGEWTSNTVTCSEAEDGNLYDVISDYVSCVGECDEATGKCVEYLDNEGDACVYGEYQEKCTNGVVDYCATESDDSTAGVVTPYICAEGYSCKVLADENYANCYAESDACTNVGETATKCFEYGWYGNVVGTVTCMATTDGKAVYEITQITEQCGDGYGECNAEGTACAEGSSTPGTPADGPSVEKNSCNLSSSEIKAVEPFAECSESDADCEVHVCWYDGEYEMNFTEYLTCMDLSVYDPSYGYTWYPVEGIYMQCNNACDASAQDCDAEGGEYGQYQ